MPNKPGFAFGILPVLRPNGSIESYQIQSQNHGLPDEVVITVIRNWLKIIEERYYEKFKMGATTQKIEQR